MSVFVPFLLCDSMQATPLAPDVRALVERFHTVPIAPLESLKGVSFFSKLSCTVSISPMCF